VRTVNALAVGFVIGMLASAGFFSWSFEPVIKKATYRMLACDTGCRTEADITCEKFRELLRPAFRPYPPGSMGDLMQKGSR
jgi:hypothetical protein